MILPGRYRVLNEGAFLRKSKNNTILIRRIDENGIGWSDDGDFITSRDIFKRNVEPEDTGMKIIVTRGVSYVGKSRYASQFSDHSVISKKHLKQVLFGDVNTKQTTGLSEMMRDILHSRLTHRAGLTVIDQSTLSTVDLMPILLLAETHKAEVEVIDFMPPSVDVLMHRATSDYKKTGRLVEFRTINRQLERHKNCTQNFIYAAKKGEFKYTVIENEIE